MKKIAKMDKMMDKKMGGKPYGEAPMGKPKK